MNKPTLEERIGRGFDELIEIVDIDVRNHTCEGWNGLGDDNFGRAILASEYKKKLKDLILTTIQEVREEERNRILAALPEEDGNFQYLSADVREFAKQLRAFINNT